ncbi:MAG: sigma-54-dependent Fis family transcriptional regulator [Spirochaetales bacterium]|nr:sigma-54-dependent Fis family transcriptional regulator [Spirochaetales bacterium]
MSDTIVLVDDEPENLIFLQKVLKHHRLKTYTNPLDAFDFIRCDESVRLLIADQKMPEISGIELVKLVDAEKKGIISIIVSAYTDPDDLVSAVNSRLIYKYIVKPYNPMEIRKLVDEIVDLMPLIRTEESLSRYFVKDPSPLDSFLTITAAGEEVKSKAEFYSESSLPLFIHGETGTGKEILARAVHQLSPRKDGPFVAVNCAALTRELFLSELFGHIKGAFSGALSDSPGFVGRADGGTLFLDEISDISLDHQAALLRLLENCTYYPVGSSIEKKADIRIISASHKNLNNMKNENLFREDLFYRLSPLELNIPPLRERKDDIALLTLHYSKKLHTNEFSLSVPAWKILFEHNWNGNVRELIHLTEKLSIYGKMYQIDHISADVIMDVLKRDEPDKISRKSDHEEEFLPEQIHLQEYLEGIEKEIISKYLGLLNNNISRTADTLGLSRQGLKNKLKRYNVVIQE